MSGGNSHDIKMKILAMVGRTGWVVRNDGEGSDGCPLALFFLRANEELSAKFGVKLASCCTPINSFLVFLPPPPLIETINLNPGTNCSKVI